MVKTAMNLNLNLDSLLKGTPIIAMEKGLEMAQHFYLDLLHKTSDYLPTHSKQNRAYYFLHVLLEPN